MKSSLTERYIYAVTRQLPYRLRQDVGAELRGLIEDMLAERCGEMPPAEKDVRVVLTELGTPAELARKYSPDGEQTLIGQPYYNTYKLVLTVVLACVAFGITLASVIGMLADGWIGYVWYEALGKWLATLMAGLCGGFTWVTVVFAIFQRMGVKLDAVFSLDDLPDPPSDAGKDKDVISRWEPIMGLVALAVFVMGLLFLPNIMSAVVNGELYAIFNAELMRSRWIALALLCLVGIAECSFQLYEGRHTPRLDLFSIGSNLVCAVLFIVLLCGPMVVNPAMLVALGPEFREFPLNFIEYANELFLAVMLLALAGDTISLIVRLARGRRPGWEAGPN